jgi:hypothetical protein
VLVTATAGRPTQTIECRLGESDPAVLERMGIDGDSHAAQPSLRVTPALLNRLSGEDLTLPNLQSPQDLAIAERAAALYPPLGDESGWSVRFGRELNATEDRHVFSTTGRGLPVIEGKHVEPFRVVTARARFRISPEDADRLLGTRHHRTRLAYRDVAGATNRLTLIAALLPPGCVSTHTVFCLRTPLPLRMQTFLCGLFNSFVVNYLVRLRVTTHVTTTIVGRLPVPRFDDAPRAARQIVALARLVCRGPNQSAFALLNARVAHLYQLTSPEFEHVVGTFPLVPEDDRAAALKAFQSLADPRYARSVRRQPGVRAPDAGLNG